jgi:hypothetical protein
MAEVVESFETPGGQEVRRIRTGENQFRWQRSVGQNRKFISDSQAQQIKENASRNAQRRNDPSLNVQYRVTPTDETDRTNAVEIKYPEIRNTEGLNPNNIVGGENKNNRIKGWMKNDSLQRQVENDQLLRTNAERERATEARAREVVEAIDNANNTRQVKQILRRYDLNS